MEKEEIIFAFNKKILLFGGQKVGKTTLIKFLENSDLIEEYIPTESKIYLKKLFIDIQSYRILDEKEGLYLNILEIPLIDSDDDNKIKEEIQLYENCFNQCHCALFMLDNSNKESFDLIDGIIPKLNLMNYPNLEIRLLINKTDLQKEINETEIEELIKLNENFQKIEISLKNKTNLNEFKNTLIQILKNTQINYPINLISEPLMPTKIILSQMLKSINLVLLGDSTVGKTSFIERYFKNYFGNCLTTIGVDSQIKIIKINNELYKLFIWDTAGQEKYRSLPKKYYKNADGILLLFDVTKQESFNNVSNWIKEINENSNQNNQNLNIILIGNKIDIDNRIISKENAEIKSKDLNFKYFEASCKYNINIFEVVSEIVIDCYNKKKMNENINDNSQKTNLRYLNNDDNESGSKGCCGKKNKKK